MYKTTNKGIGFIGGLQLLLIGLKLTEHVDWAWWLVLLPLITNVAVIIFVITIILYDGKNKKC